MQPEYAIRLQWKDGADLARRAEHEFLLGEKSGQTLEFACHFSPASISDELPDFAKTRSAAEKHWRQFWTHGGVIDLSGSSDPRALELERRIVLSLYNTALHCAGSLPSAETGLLCNSWYGKFHLEMHWWHSVHFTAWNRFELIREESGDLRTHSAAGARHRPTPGLSRCALAENDRAGRARFPFAHRPAAHLAAAPSDLLRRTVLSPATGQKDFGALAGNRF